MNFLLRLWDWIWTSAETEAKRYIDELADKLTPEPSEDTPSPDLPDPASSTPVLPPEHIQGSGTTVWKPESENDDKLVVLTDCLYRYGAEARKPWAKYELLKVWIEGGPRNGEQPHKIYHPENKEGKKVNGDRAHCRFKKTGKKYGKDIRLVVKFRVVATGEIDFKRYEIGNGKKRYEIRRRG